MNLKEISVAADDDGGDHGWKNGYSHVIAAPDWIENTAWCLNIRQSVAVQGQRMLLIGSCRSPFFSLEQK